MLDPWRGAFAAVLRRYRWLTAVVVLLGLAGAVWGVVVLWEHRELVLETAVEMRELFAGWLQRAGKGWFFVAFAVAPLFFMPVSIFYLTAGVYGYEWAIPLVWGALAVNVTLAYWISAHGFHPVIERLVGRWGYRIPRVPPGEELKVALIVRIAPALPFSIQSYLLGLARIPFRSYMAVSLGFQAPMAAGMILLGDSLFRGRVGLAIAGVCVIVIVVLIIQILRNRYDPKS